MANIERLKKHLARDEGYRGRAYEDTEGITTIGYGFNIGTRDMPKVIADAWLEHEITGLLVDPRLRLLLDVLDDARQEVILNMAYNLGVSGVLNFKKMVKAIKAKDWNRAADEMLDSKWAIQVGVRSTRLAEAMRRGVFDV